MLKCKSIQMFWPILTIEPILDEMNDNEYYLTGSKEYYNNQEAIKVLASLSEDNNVIVLDEFWENFQLEWLLEDDTSKVNSNNDKPKEKGMIASLKEIFSGFTDLLKALVRAAIDGTIGGLRYLKRFLGALVEACKNEKVRKVFKVIVTALGKTVKAVICAPFIGFWMGLKALWYPFSYLLSKWNDKTVKDAVAKQYDPEKAARIEKLAKSGRILDGIKGNASSGNDITGRESMSKPIATINAGSQGSLPALTPRR